MFLVKKGRNVLIIFILAVIQDSCAKDVHMSFINFPDRNGEREIVILTASYNNKEWYQWNLDSVFAQQYHNYRVIYIDDCSIDGTADLVEAYVKEKGQEHRFTLIRNTYRQGAVANHYHAIHTCNDRAIIAIVDGDDAIANSHVLQFLNKIYADNNVWLTYGQFIEYPTGEVGFCRDMPRYVIRNNAFRNFNDIPSHMRTFYAGLYKHIKKEDLMLDGAFLEMLADIAAMFPMIEMARNHFKFIPEILYTYNAANEINDYKVSKSKQRSLDLMVRARQRYDEISSPLTQ